MDRNRNSRSELNYVVSGALVLLLGGALVNASKGDGGVIVGVIAGVALIAVGFGLLGRGILRRPVR